MTSKEVIELFNGLLKSKDALRRSGLNGNEYNLSVSNGFFEALEVVIKALEQEPIKGEWIVKSQKTRILHSNEVFKCKKCGHERSRYDGEILKYCPNCGVNMVESEV